MPVAEGSLITTDPSVAAAALATGHLAALPTETVYGLAADASNLLAVERLFAVKGRPRDHPVIVHVAGASAITHWALDIPGYAHALIKVFWPGPLTLILRRSDQVSDAVTGGQETVALRCSAHPLMGEVLAQLALRLRLGTGVVGVAAPSANRFGRVSPTTAEHVVAELGNVLIPGRDVVLAGGAADIGIESTILDCTGDRPHIVRLGYVTADQIMGVTPLVYHSPGALNDTPRAPGTHPRHYSPQAAVEVLGAEMVARRSAELGELIGLLAPADIPTPSGVLRLAAPRTDTEYARVLYAALHRADEQGLIRVLVVMPPDTGNSDPGICDPGIGAAIRDRVTRAATASGVADH